MLLFADSMKLCGSLTCVWDCLSLQANLSNIQKWTRIFDAQTISYYKWLLHEWRHTSTMSVYHSICSMMMSIIIQSPYTIQIPLDIMRLHIYGIFYVYSKWTAYPWCTGIETHVIKTIPPYSLGPFELLSDTLLSTHILFELWVSKRAIRVNRVPASLLLNNEDHYYPLVTPVSC